MLNRITKTLHHQRHNDPRDRPQLREDKTFPDTLNLFVCRAPTFNLARLKVDMPIVSMLDRPIGTSIGTFAIQHPKANTKLLKMLNG